MLSKNSLTAAQKNIGTKIFQSCCGQYGTIVAYNNYRDIAVRFEDGTIVYHKSCGNFKKGQIKNPNVRYKPQKRAAALGLRKKMNNGKYAVIIGYQRCNDITVQFEEDGAIVEHKQMSQFQTGEIAHPSNAPINDKNCRLGEINFNNAGLAMEIVKYRTSTDMDVLFPIDNTIVSGVTYPNFIKGAVAHPVLKPIRSLSLQEFAIRYYLEPLGFVKIDRGAWVNKGFGYLELDFYHKEKSIAIEFDGAIHSKPNVAQYELTKNKKCKECGIVLYRLRHHSTPVLKDENSINYVLSQKNDIVRGFNNCKTELEEILNNHNIDIPADYIDFVRDKDTIINAFHKVTLSYYKDKYEGQVVYNKTAKEYMQLIRYNAFDNVDVKFLFSGLIRHNVSYSNFAKGTVRRPDKQSESLKQERLNQSKMQKCGYVCKVVEYRNAKDIDVEFEDGVRLCNRAYHRFEKGEIKHPSLTPEGQKQSRLGTISYTKTGKEAKIIKYVKNDDITVQFADGVIKEHITYNNFIKGAFSYPGEHNYDAVVQWNKNRATAPKS